MRRELGVLRRSALERQNALSSVVVKNISTESELRDMAQQAVDALEQEQARSSESFREAQASVSELREYVQSADQTHSRAEEVAAKEITRLRAEAEALRGQLRTQRRAHERDVERQEETLNNLTESARAEATRLREVVVRLQKTVSQHRQAAERERARLVSDVERLTGEATDALEERNAADAAAARRTARGISKTPLIRFQDRPTSSQDTSQTVPTAPRRPQRLSKGLQDGSGSLQDASKRPPFSFLSLNQQRIPT